MPNALHDFIRESFAANAGLPVSEIFEGDLTLAEIIGRSPHMTNSVDLMEGFAKTANLLRREYGRRVRLPSFTLDSRVSVVLDAIVVQITEVRSAG